LEPCTLNLKLYTLNFPVSLQHLLQVFEVLISSAFLSVRHRLMRGKRRATPIYDGTGGNAFESYFKHQLRLYGSHRAEFFEGVFLYKGIHLGKLLIGKPRVGLL